MKSALELLQSSLRVVPDFPKPGIQFVDITPVLQNGQLFRLLVNLIVERYAKKQIDVVAGVDARGFIIGAAAACLLGAGFVPIRKKGKLPHVTVEQSYDLEYGSATVQLHEDAIRPGQRVLLVDDLLATGGTASAAARLVRQLGGELIEVLFFIELPALNGRAKLPGENIHSIIQV
jgi:adenine phosphoribosyltransferase